MPPSLSTIWIHTLFSTNNLEPHLQPELRSRLLAHIKEHLERDFKCPVQTIDGTLDHLHILFNLNPNYALKDILKNVKGESSHWINQNGFLESTFAWEKGYAAVSVSASKINAIEMHIHEQAQYHENVPFFEERHRIFALQHAETGKSSP